jgi:hypothetical protein
MIGASSNYDELFAQLFISSYDVAAYNILSTVYSKMALHIKYDKGNNRQISLWSAGSRGKKDR